MLNLNLLEWPFEGHKKLLRKTFNLEASATEILILNSLEETEHFAHLLAPTLTLANRPQGKSYERLQVAVSATPASGKTPLIKYTVNAFDDFHETQTGDFKEFKGYSATFGKISSADLAYGMDDPSAQIFYRNRKSLISANEYAQGIDFTQYPEHGDRLSHMIIRMGHYKKNGPNSRYLKVFCEHGLAQIEGFQNLLEATKSMTKIPSL